MIIASLHGHSKYSDGLNTPTQIVKEAIKQNITYLAITDHNNVKSIPELYQACQNTNTIPIAGIEFMTKDGDLIAYKLGNLKQITPFLKWATYINSRKIPALNIILEGLQNHNCLFVIPHPCLVHSLQEKHIKEIYLSLTPKDRQRIAIEINNGATQVLNNKNRLNRVTRTLSKYPFNLVNGPDYHHKKWISLAISTLPNHKPSYEQFEKYFIQGKFTHDTPNKLQFNQIISILWTHVQAFLRSRYTKPFGTVAQFPASIEYKKLI